MIFFTLDPLKFSLYDCEPVLQGEASFAKFRAQEIAAHKQFAQKETGCYYASLAKHRHQSRSSGINLQALFLCQFREHDQMALSLQICIGLGTLFF